MRIKMLLLAGLCSLLVACGDDESPYRQVDEKHYQWLAGKDVGYTVSDGVLVFDNAKDMFNRFNLYSIEGGQLEFYSEKPLSIRVSHQASSESDVLKDFNELALIHAIYYIFTHTKEPQVTIDAYPQVIDIKTNKVTSHPELSIKATVTRDKALAVLQKHTGAESFIDLVQLQKNDELRTVGQIGSKLWDKFGYAYSKQRAEIVTDLIQ